MVTIVTMVTVTIVTIVIVTLVTIIRLLEKEPSSNAQGVADVEVVLCTGLELPEDNEGVYVALVSENYC